MFDRVPCCSQRCSTSSQRDGFMHERSLFRKVSRNALRWAGGARVNTTAQLPVLNLSRVFAFAAGLLVGFAGASAFDHHKRRAAHARGRIAERRVAKLVERSRDCVVNLRGRGPVDVDGCRTLIGVKESRAGFRRSSPKERRELKRLARRRRWSTLQAMVRDDHVALELPDGRGWVTELRDLRRRSQRPVWFRLPKQGT